MIGARIRQARLKAGLTLDALRDGLRDRGHSITKAALSKYERDETRVPADLLPKLSQVLEVPPEYFLNLEPQVPITFERFRKKCRFGLRKQEQLKAAMRDQVERYIELLDLSGAERSDWRLPERRPLVATPEEAETAAEDLRRAWGLGTLPIESLCQLLEDKDFIVLPHEEPGGEFDGLCGVAGTPPGLPLIIFDPSKPPDRRRLSLAHELGHLVMDHPEGMPERDCERLAYRFAGSFLVPADLARRELGRNRQLLDLRELEMLKERYGLSMAAWIRRAHDLGIISEIQYKMWCRLFSVRGWRWSEPHQYQNPLEEPRRRRRLALRTLAEGRISPSQAERLCPGVLDGSAAAPPGAPSLRSLLADRSSPNAAAVPGALAGARGDDLEDFDLGDPDPTEE